MLLLLKLLKIFVRIICNILKQFFWKNEAEIVICLFSLLYFRKSLFFKIFFHSMRRETLVLVKFFLVAANFWVKLFLLLEITFVSATYRSPSSCSITLSRSLTSSFLKFEFIEKR